MRGFGHLAKFTKELQFIDGEPMKNLGQIATWISLYTLILVITQC